MGIQQTPQSLPAHQETLPQLIKQSSTYKLHVPKKVEEKIRYLIRKFPHTEWSGVLFYNYTGSFEDGSLLITCEDIFPMDLGSNTFTSFKMNEDVATYMAQNMELFDCEIGIIHSHHSIGAFHSGTDLDSLRSEGNDTNCVVSLVVDTKGTYDAAITRKVVQKKKVTVETSASLYEFFGEGRVSSGSFNREITDLEEVAIEYFKLDVSIEQVDNPLAYLDDRFKAIEAKKNTWYQSVSMPTLPASRIVSPKWNDEGGLVQNKEDKDEEFYDWIHSDRKKSAEAKEALLFPKEEMGEIDITKWKPDLTVIHRMVIYLITCSFITSDNIDLKQWVHNHMVKMYDRIFPDEEMFTEWRDFIIEFLITHYSCEMDIPSGLIDDYDTWQSKIAEAMIDELGEYQTNGYIDQYVQHLMQYVV